MKLQLALTGIIIVNILFFCTNNSIETAAPESSPSYRGLYGMLVDDDGVTMSGVMVKAIPVGTSLSKRASTSPLEVTVSDTAYTDSNGIYAFRSLNAGIYNLQGDYNNKSMVVLITDVTYDSTGAIQQVDTDTLRAPGQIAGSVTTPGPGDDGVLCYIPGTSFLSITDNDGGFILSDIPQGYYNLMYRKDGLTTVCDSGIEVRSGEKTVVPEKIMETDPNSLPPAPEGVSVVYDTLSGCAAVTWSPVIVSDLAGYVIYGNDPLVINPVQLNTLLCTDTVYIDTVFSDPNDTTDKVLTYRIKSMDIDANLSDVYSSPCTIDAPSPVKVSTLFSWDFFNTVGDTARVNDTVSIIVNYRNATRKNVSLSWYVNNRDTVYSTTPIDMASAGNDTIRYAWSAPVKPRIFVSITDNAGTIWWDSTMLTIIQDEPIRYMDISAGSDYTLFLETDGTVWACGRNNEGQLGDGTNQTRTTPVMVMEGVKKVCAGYWNSFFLKTDYSLWGCGSNKYGGIGDGTTEDRQNPVQVMTDVEDVSAGQLHSLILKTDGTLWSCGANQHGQLGDGTKITQLTPIQVMSDVKKISAGEYAHSLILKNDNSLWGCGMNNVGQLGDGTTTNRVTPVQVMTDVADMSTGFLFSQILKTDGSLFSCGQNIAGQLGDSTKTTQTVPVQIMNDVRSIKCADAYSLIIKNDESLWGCGSTGFETADPTIPVQLMTYVQQVATGQYHSIILKTDGTLWSLGKNQNGQLADGTTTDRSSPVRIQLPE